MRGRVIEFMVNKTVNETGLKRICCECQHCLKRGLRSVTVWHMIGTRKIFQQSDFIVLWGRRAKPDEFRESQVLQ